MNKRYSFLVLGIVSLSGAIFYLFSIGNVQRSSRKQIALILPAVHPSMEAIEEGFITTLAQIVPDVQVVVYNANGNKTLLKGQAEKIVRQKYEACCAVGTNASTMLATALVKNHSKMPLFAIAIAPEVSERLAGVYNRVTGITDSVNKTKQVEILLAMKQVKKPVLVYDPASNPAFEKDEKEYANLFKKHGITLAAIPVYSVQEVYQKLAGTIGAYDLVITLTDHTVCAAMDALIKLCNQHHITLYTSELDSNDKGAALSYGVKEREYGVGAAHLLHTFYKDGRVPQFKKSGPFYLKINKEAAIVQNVTSVGNVSLPGVKVLYKESVNG